MSDEDITINSTNKIAYIIVGPESSGTKMMTQLMIDAGCYGSASSDQLLNLFVADKNAKLVVPINTNKLVVHRSIPWGQEWPDLSIIMSRFRAVTWEIFFIFLTRDWGCLAKSKIKRGHKKNLDQAKNCIEQEHEFIFGFILKYAPNWIMIDSSLIFKIKEKALIRLSGITGLTFDCNQVFDADEKHYG